ncbi:UDP-N-acetylglucosamine 2-epimerase [Mesorhizobium sp. KR1-2]|uniref:UDP-N-acetylglucosamine 2-epimerase n=1 Tax=Mesorhizobium sp. KR1-2 TaxID=3156609 RepID=UPI0032B5CFB8
MRKILIATVGRSDYGVCRPVMNRIATESGLCYELLVTGAHLSQASGGTIDEIVNDSRPISGRVPLPETLGGPRPTAEAMGVAMAGSARVFAEKRPDLLLVLGDRFEMFAVASAAVPFNIPIAHIHGGELSFGAIDEVFRHAITKMAHLHFAATMDYADRIVRMGEEPWRVTVSGAPSLDTIREAQLPDPATLAQRFGISLERPPLLVTFHPVTRQPEQALGHVSALLNALRQVDIPVVLTAPNADAGSDIIRAEYLRFLDERADCRLVENFGALNYLAMLREAAAVIGNSSSGLIETPALKVPTVNIGERQQGRTRAANVIDVPTTADEILGGIRKALDPAFRSSLVGLVNPYGDGHAAERIVEVLKSVELGPHLLAKRFYDGPGSAAN